MIRDLPTLTAFDAYRFCQYLKPSSENDCIEWQSTYLLNGYGRFKLGGHSGQSYPAHRIAYWLATKQKPPTTLNVCHSCNNRKCCNPVHLYLDTQKGNIQYAASLGRMKGGTPKVTAGDVLEMRIKASQGASTKDLAQIYDMNVVTIRSIIAHRTWKHVGGPLIKRKGGSSKLTPEQVEFIFNSKATGVALAKQFNVTGGTISNIKNGITFQSGYPGQDKDLLEN